MALSGVRRILVVEVQGVPRPYENVHPPTTPLGPYGRVLVFIYFHKRDTPVPLCAGWKLETFPKSLKYAYPQDPQMVLGREGVLLDSRPSYAGRWSLVFKP